MGGKEIGWVVWRFDGRGGDWVGGKEETGYSRMGRMIRQYSLPFYSPP